MIDIEELKSHFESDEFTYPRSFVKAVELNLFYFDIWRIFENDEAFRRMEGLKERYPQRKLIPFAKRDDCDDIACFEIGKGDKIQIIHDYASKGYEQRMEYDDFWEWLRDAVDVMIEYNRDEERYG